MIWTNYSRGPQFSHLLNGGAVMTHTPSQQVAVTATPRNLHEAGDPVPTKCSAKVKMIMHIISFLHLRDIIHRSKVDAPGGWPLQVLLLTRAFGVQWLRRSRHRPASGPSQGSCRATSPPAPPPGLQWQGHFSSEALPPAPRMEIGSRVKDI